MLAAAATPVAPPPARALVAALPRARGLASATLAPVTDREEAEALFSAARAGSSEAWADLYALVRPALFRYARLRLATDDQADDAVSETMARAIGAADRYQPGAGPVAWLVGICRNVVFETYRSGGRGRTTDPGLLSLGTAPTPEPGPAETALHREEEQGLRAAFDRLGPDDREVLVLRVVVGLDAEESAAALGKRAGAVRMAQSRALGRLRALLEETGPEPQGEVTGP